MPKKKPIIDLNEHRLRKEIDELAKDKDIIKFARWVNENVTDEFLIETKEKEVKVMTKSVSISQVDDGHTMFGSPVAGNIHVTEFEGEEIIGGQFFTTLDDAFAHIRDYLKNSVVLTHNDIN